MSEDTKAAAQDALDKLRKKRALIAAIEKLGAVKDAALIEAIFAAVVSSKTRAQS